MGKKLSDADYLRIKKNIIKRLYSNKAFSKGHLLYERLTAGVPSHLTGFVESVLDDILTRRDPYRAEWLNASFVKTGNIWTINYAHKISGGFVQPTVSETLETCLMEVGFVDLFSASRQGLPTRKSANQDIYFYPPLSEGNSVAGFGAGSGGVYLGCGRNPQSYGTGLGVRKFFER